jgi:hypothetical protein
VIPSSRANAHISYTIRWSWGMDFGTLAEPFKSREIYRVSAAQRGYVAWFWVGLVPDSGDGGGFAAPEWEVRILAIWEWDL